MIRRLFLFTLVLATAQAELAAAELPKPGKNFDFTSDSGAEFDFGTRDFVGRGHARLTYGDATLFADEIRYQQDTKIAKVKGHVSITRDALRLVADSGTYNFSTGELSVVNLRMGDYPVYLSGDTVMGNLKELTFTNAALTFKEPNSATPSIHADRITYIPGQRIIAEHVRMGIGTYRPLYLSKIEQSLTAPFLNDSTFEAGYRHNLGAWFDFGLRLPVAEGVKLGGELGVYTARGIMFGPTGSYILKQGESETTGYFRSGFIHDTGSTGLDILNRPISKSRGYVEWQQRSQITDNLTFVGQLNYWKDSEVLRDFRARAFYNMQQPDSYLESVYTGKNYFVSLFARLRPNNFEDVQQRMPEVRFDLLPTAIGEGFYERFNVSGAILREDPLTLDPLTGNYIRGSVLRSDRFDAYYALTRPFLPREWLSFTPVVGGRLTYYNQALAGKNNYTRTLGEFGFDAALRANGVYNYKNEFWKIDGIRHLLEPKLSYRYTPEAEQGSRYIPQIDRQVFNTNLQPISLGDMRNIDQLQKLNVVRLGLDNTFQTRDSKYGSRDLLTVNFANDFRFEHTTGQKDVSELYTEVAFTPAKWIKFEVFDRLAPQSFTQREINTGLSITDSTWWTLRFSTHYLQQPPGTLPVTTAYSLDQVNEYYVDYTLRFNEVWEGLVRLRYDMHAHRMNEQSYGLRQNLNNTWNILYEVSYYKGQSRGSSLGFNIGIELLKF